MSTRKATTFITILCCVVLFFSLPAAQAENTPEISILTTVFPAYDFASVIVGDTANVQLLLPPGTESHSYEPTPQDIISIQDADLFIYVGGESDHWVENILSSMGNDAPKAIRLMDCVAVVKEEYTLAMEHDHAHNEHEDHDHDEDHTAELDEHVWTSPKNAMLIASSLANTLTTLSPANEGIYSSNLQAYLTELEALDAAFTDVVANGKCSKVIFGDRFPLRYFVDAYQLQYDAAFPGCSEDSEPNIRTIMTLIDEIKTEEIPVVFYIEFSSQKTANIIAEETGAKTLLFHSCHNVSFDEMENGASYLSLMRSNVDALKEALN
ncbi:MAG: zinc ABC transporter substrate-binding protein [Clostridiales bacterium]|nr:zinc ABC transporter substrate-binding protein [Clostridiales bacterium]